MPAGKVPRQDLRDAAEKYKNWGKWGPNDEIGTLNFTAPEDIVAAAQLVKKGKVISLALNFDHTGPQGAKSKYPSMVLSSLIPTIFPIASASASWMANWFSTSAADDMVT